MLLLYVTQHNSRDYTGKELKKNKVFKNKKFNGKITIRIIRRVSKSGVLTQIEHRPILSGLLYHAPSALNDDTTYNMASTVLHDWLHKTNNHVECGLTSSPLYSVSSIQSMTKLLLSFTIPDITYVYTLHSQHYTQSLNHIQKTWWQPKQEF